MGPRGVRRRVSAPLSLLQKWAVPAAGITCDSSHPGSAAPAAPRSHPGEWWAGEGTPVLLSGRGPQVPGSTGLSQQLHLASRQGEGPRRRARSRERPQWEEAV